MRHNGGVTGQGVRIVVAATSCLILMTGVTSCSSSSATSNTLPATVAVCDGITNQSVGELLGRHTTAYPRPNEPSECYFIERPGTSVLGATVTVDKNSSTASSRSWLNGQFAATRVPGYGTYDISGTAAVWLPYPPSVGGGGRLAALRNDEIVAVTVNASASATPLTAAQSVMELVFSTIHTSTSSTTSQS